MTTPRITKTPGVCGGRARIEGHRVRVLDIAIAYERLGQTPDQIVADLPSITLSDVHSALAYYYDHREEIQEDIREEYRCAEEHLRANPSQLAAKLATQDLIAS